MAELFNLVLTTSLYSSVVGVVILLVKALLKNRISAFWHYALWLVLVVKLVIPFGPESMISLFNRVPVSTAQLKVTDITSGTQQEPRAVIPAADVPETAAPPEIPAASVKTGISIGSALPYVWALGAILMLGWLLFTHHTLYRKLRRNALPVGERITLILESSKRKMGIKRDIALTQQDILGTPALLGVVKPQILLSPAVSRLSDKEIQYILLHELAHYKRKDILVNYLLLAFQTVYWFNPILWYCFKRMRHDMEMATDEAVLGILENKEHRDYGRAILAVLDSFISPKLVPKLMGMVDEKKNIEKRIKRIACFKKPKVLWSIAALMMVLVIGLMCLTSANSAGARGKGTDGNSVLMGDYDVDRLLNYKFPYIGNASNVSNLLERLPLGEYKQKISLSTESEPFGITVYYNLVTLQKADMDIINQGFLPNSAILLSLIDNLDIIRYNIQEGNSSYTYIYTRSMLQKYFDRDIREYAKDKKDFTVFLSKLKSTDWMSSPTATFLDSTEVALNAIKQIRIEIIGNEGFKKFQTQDPGIIAQFIRDLNNVKLLPLPQRTATKNLSDGFYLVLNTGEKDYYFYIDYSTGIVARHSPVMSSFPGGNYRFEDTRKLRSTVNSFLENNDL